MIKMFKRSIATPQRKYNKSVYRIQTILPNLVHSQPKFINAPLMIRLSTTKDIPKNKRLIRWTEHDLMKLVGAISKHGRDWKFISKEYFNGDRTPSGLEAKWNHFLTKDELMTLVVAVFKRGEDWNFISKEYFNGNRSPYYQSNGNTLGVNHDLDCYFQLKNTLMKRIGRKYIN